MLGDCFLQDKSKVLLAGWCEPPLPWRDPLLVIWSSKKLMTTHHDTNSPEKTQALLKKPKEQWLHSHIVTTIREVPSPGAWKRFRWVQDRFYKKYTLWFWGFGGSAQLLFLEWKIRIFSGDPYRSYHTVVVESWLICWNIGNDYMYMFFMFLGRNMLAARCFWTRFDWKIGVSSKWESFF